MTIGSAMNAGVSGLQACASALAAISSNIANVNTPGYKRQATAFASRVSAQGGGYAAGGVSANPHQHVSQLGPALSTQSATDLAISGSGFFVTTKKAEGVGPTDTRLFTRAGSFTPDKQGYLRNDAGLYLQGWLADPITGAIKADPSDLSRLSSINVSALGGASDKTSRVAINANLNAAQAVSAAIGAYVPGALSDYARDPATGVKPDFDIQIPVSDSKGGNRSLTLSVLKGPGPNEWFAELRAKPGDLANNANGLISSGKITFTNDGKLLDTGGLLTGDPPTVSIGASDPSASGGGAQWADGLGIAAQTIQLDLNRAAGGLTQYASASTVQGVEANGAALGAVLGVEIDDHGYVTATFDNGVHRRIAQVAVATFANPDSLRATNGNAYQLTGDSGGYSLKAPGEGDAGDIASSTLEGSTVDLSVEFTDLIRVQRAYSACSKIIKIADEMLQELLDMKR